MAKRAIMVLKRSRSPARVSCGPFRAMRNTASWRCGDGGHGEVVPVSFGLGPPFILFHLYQVCLKAA